MRNARVPSRAPGWRSAHRKLPRGVGRIPHNGTSPSFPRAVGETSLAGENAQKHHSHRGAPSPRDRTQQEPRPLSRIPETAAVPGGDLPERFLPPTEEPSLFDLGISRAPRALLRGGTRATAGWNSSHSDLRGGDHAFEFSIAAVSEWLGCWIEDPGVVGSSPAPAPFAPTN